MGSMSLIHWIILGAIALLLFGGKNKISDVMGDVAKGLKSFKKGLMEDDEKPVARPQEPVRTIDHFSPAVQPQAPLPHAEVGPVAGAPGQGGTGQVGAGQVGAGKLG